MSVTVVSPTSTLLSVDSLEQAVLETLAYSDIFDYPLTFDELHRYLIVPATRAQLSACLREMQTESSPGFHHLPHRSEIVSVRRARDAASRNAFLRALFYGRILGRLPFIRMVALTGSLAVLNLSKDADMDFMLITRPGRLWIARAFAVTFGRLMRLLGDRICVNLLVSENALAWPLQDLYSAREMAQMIPIVGMNVYRRLRDLNPWTTLFLPNASSVPGHAPSKVGESGSTLQRLLEFPLLGRFGAWLDEWTMNFQLRKITRRYGKGAEANFSADVCQGNFHGHRKQTDENFQARMDKLGLSSKSESAK